MTVYAVTPIRDDTAPALRFGEIRHVNQYYVYGDELVDQRLPGIVTRPLLRAAEEFDPVHDFVLIAGDHLQLTWFIAALARRHSSICVLRWDKKAEGYIPAWI